MDYKRHKKIAIENRLTKIEKGLGMIKNTKQNYHGTQNKDIIKR